MNIDEIHTLRDAEDFISGVQHGRDIGLAHIAVMLAKIRRDRLFIEVSNSWKNYISQDRFNLGYRQSIHLAKIGEIYLTFRVQLEENGITMSDNMSKMVLFDSEIASHDPVFFDKFKRLSYRKLEKYISDYRSNRINVYPDEHDGGNITVKGASLYIDGEKAKGLNLNEISEAVHAGKRFVVVAVDDDNEARRIKRRIEK